MVPSNFVEVVADDNGDKLNRKEIEVFAASEDDTRKATQIIKVYRYTCGIVTLHNYI